jgi:tRNA threonylcarbamoyl adenosine modification protein (Sua5/YciO/YrdC/YwlC family)
VSFPTETVYGLGCNALDPEAILKVFQAKERPLTDPLISHVTNPQDAFDLWEADTSADTASMEGKALRALCEAFWPGPLTLVARAAPHVPPTLMANTGFVACRAPKHPISVALINAAKVPVAAPSANKFGHVSPTRSQHVWDDLKYEDVWIVVEEDESNSKEQCCEIGVESSVVKIEMNAQSSGKQGRITLLRQGAVSIQDIQNCLNGIGLAESFEILAKTKKATDETVAHVAPGQTIRHYSPNVPSFVLSRSFIEQSVAAYLGNKEKRHLASTVLVDFDGKLQPWEAFCLAYMDLSPSGDSAEASKRVFETLRWAEQVDGANKIMFPEVSSDDGSLGQDALMLALKDKLNRAASGVVIDSFELSN